MNKFISIINKFLTLLQIYFLKINFTVRVNNLLTITYFKLKLPFPVNCVQLTVNRLLRSIHEPCWDIVRIQFKSFNRHVTEVYKFTINLGNNLKEVKFKIFILQSVTFSSLKVTREWRDPLLINKVNFFSFRRFQPVLPNFNASGRYL